MKPQALERWGSVLEVGGSETQLLHHFVIRAHEIVGAVATPTLLRQWGFLLELL